ncbi:MAG: hypothetical protein NUV86_07600 [Candidatus Scalindua sp.]|nr:hypothetical protein [Candidatus Scalindua sp.]MCR4344372.1 hypothetical protein [Candidatus Scalindua sp.]
MHTSEDFAQELINAGYDFFTGVPCSIIGNLITNLTDRPDVTYIPTVREDTSGLNAKLRALPMFKYPNFPEPHLQAPLLINSHVAWV